MKKTKFPNRIVLGSGYPWAIGTEDYKEIGLSSKVVGVELEILNFPNELWENDCPKYKLILQKEKI